MMLHSMWSKQEEYISTIFWNSPCNNKAKFYTMNLKREKNVSAKQQQKQQKNVYYTNLCKFINLLKIFTDFHFVIKLWNGFKFVYRFIVKLCAKNLIIHLLAKLSIFNRMSVYFVQRTIKSSLVETITRKKQSNN